LFQRVLQQVHVLGVGVSRPVELYGAHLLLKLVEGNALREFVVEEVQEFEDLILKEQVLEHQLFLHVINALVIRLRGGLFLLWRCLLSGPHGCPAVVALVLRVSLRHDGHKRLRFALDRRCRDSFLGYRALIIFGTEGSLGLIP